MNYIELLMKHNDLKFGERFEIKGIAGYKFWFIDDFTLKSDFRDGAFASIILDELLLGEKKIIKGPWKPEEYEKYYFVESTGNVRSTRFENVLFDYAMLMIGNCFESEEIAKKCADEIVEKIKNYYESYGSGNDE